MTIHVFLGPTLSPEEARQAVPGAVVHPPIRHGDLLALHLGPGDTVVVIDGVFHQTAPVRHKEITDALRRGARVIGASSMGALRAAELWQCGMEGVGLVFGMYARGDLDADDEVAVGHLPSGDYRALTVPLVNIRWTIANAVAEDALTAGAGDVLLEVARSLHYTQRSWGALVHTASRTHPEAAEAAVALRAFAERRPDLSDLKHRDALLALAHAREPRPGGPVPADIPAPLVPRTMYLERWRALHRPATAAPGGQVADVGELDQLRFQQLYTPDFPGRYRRFALRRIAGGGAGHADVASTDDSALADAALKAAEERGITADRLPDGAWASWLTEEERASGDARSRLLTLLVRSFRVGPGAAPFNDVPAELRDEDGAWALSAGAVAAADRLNTQMARTGRRRTPRHLPGALVRRHLADVWRATGPDGLAAAAHDRGFFSLEEAEEAARRFVLLHRVGAAPRTAAG
ncbi:TfuA-like protein [Streptomyces mobaraensis]|uniref:TfuA-like protein n=1 Tax=Streptomyces mobaraensis TaxID=35621 RepID=UPI0033E6B622